MLRRRVFLDRRFEPCKEAGREEADEVVCLETPSMLGAIGLYYRDIHQMSDAQVTDFLARAARLTPEAPIPFGLD